MNNRPFFNKIKMKKQVDLIDIKILKTISNKPNWSISDICNFLNILKYPNINLRIWKLKEMGYITITSTTNPNNKERGVVNQLEITNQGETMIEIFLHELNEFGDSSKLSISKPNKFIFGEIFPIFSDRIDLGILINGVDQGITINEISKTLGTSRISIWAHIKKLQERKYIERTEEGRNVIIKTTKKGEDVYDLYLKTIRFMSEYIDNPNKVKIK